MPRFKRIAAACIGRRPGRFKRMMRFAGFRYRPFRERRGGDMHASAASRLFRRFAYLPRLPAPRPLDFTLISVDCRGVAEPRHDAT